jgi:ankyrin repeat protein
MLPLHHAVENRAPLAVIDLLAEAFKPAIFQQYTPTTGQKKLKAVLYASAEDVDCSEIYCCLLRHSMSFLRHSVTGGWSEIESFFRNYGHRHEKATKALLRMFPDFAKRKGSNGDLPLHSALRACAPEEVVALLAVAYPNALITLSSKDSKTPLHMLFKGPSLRIKLVELLTIPEAAKMRDAHDNLPIHSYCNRSHQIEIFHPAILEELVDAHPESVMQRDKYERTPLLCHLSSTPSAESNLPGIEYLVQSNPECIKLVDKDGKNALHHACNKRGPLSSTVIHYLYETYPENLITLDSSGRSPLHYLCDVATDEDLPLFELMHEVTPQSFSLLSKDGLSPLHVVCYSSAWPSNGLVRFLAEACPLALRVIAKGATPFHFACMRQNVQVQVIRFLAKECPDLLEENTENSPFHETPLHVLCRNEHIADADLRNCLRALTISRDAVEMLGRDRNSTLHALCRRRASLECLQIILEKSPDLIFARNANAQTALHVAVESCASDQESNGNVELLLDKYPLGIQDVDIDFKTPLVVACEKDVSLGVIYHLVHVDPISSLDMLRNAFVVIPTLCTGKRKRGS